MVSTIEMKHLFVLDDWRRRSIGTALVVAAVAQARHLAELSCSWT